MHRFSVIRKTFENAGCKISAILFSLEFLKYRKWSVSLWRRLCEDCRLYGDNYVDWGAISALSVHQHVAAKEAHNCTVFGYPMTTHGRHGATYHRQIQCLFSSLFSLTTRKLKKLQITCLCEGNPSAWWRHQMVTFSGLLALCYGNSPVTGEFPSQMPTSGALIFSLVCAWTNGWLKNWNAGDLRRHRAHLLMIWKRSMPLHHYSVPYHVFILTSINLEP